MALRTVSSRIVASFVVLLLGALSCNANLDCTERVVDGYTFNLTKLITKEVTISQRIKTPPSWTNYTDRISPCGPLLKRDGDQDDQCPETTRACRIVTIHREDIHPEKSLVSQIIPIADNGSDVKDAELRLGLSPTGDKLDEPSLIVTLYGAKPYMNKTQQLNIIFNCRRESGEDTHSVNYTGEVLNLVWNTTDVCGEKVEQPQTAMGSFSKFLLYASLFVLVYVGFGAFYNFRVYGSTGWDLLPHRDFWRDMPYLVSDLVKTAYNSMRTGGRAGYHSV